MAAVEEQLAREARRAPLAAIGACVAAALPMIGERGAPCLLGELFFDGGHPGPRRVPR